MGCVAIIVPGTENRRKLLGSAHTPVATFGFLGGAGMPRGAVAAYKAAARSSTPRSIVVMITKTLNLDTASTEGREGRPGVDSKGRQRATVIAH